MDMKLCKYDTVLAKYKIAFESHQEYSNNITSNRILFRDLNLRKISIIIGLNFLLNDQFGLIALWTGMYISAILFLPLTPEFTWKLGGIEDCICKILELCKQVIDN